MPPRQETWQEWCQQHNHYYHVHMTHNCHCHIAYTVQPWAGNCKWNFILVALSYTETTLKQVCLRRFTSTTPINRRSIGISNVIAFNTPFHQNYWVWREVPVNITRRQQALSISLAIGTCHIRPFRIFGSLFHRRAICTQTFQGRDMNSRR